MTPRVFGLIVGARLKSRIDLSVMIGWQTVRFDRTKDVKALAHYLEPPKQKPKGPDSLRGMIARMKQKQEARDGTE